MGSIQIQQSWGSILATVWRVTILDSVVGFDPPAIIREYGVGRRRVVTDDHLVVGSCSYNYH
jgi:hypothetical protein